MARKKTDRSVIKLVDKEPDENGISYTPSVYYTVKNKRQTPDKIKLKKFNKYKNRHTDHLETKIK